MSSLPPDNDEDAGADASYRRLSAADPSRPSDEARQAVLTHAMRLGRPGRQRSGRPARVYLAAPRARLAAPHDFRRTGGRDPRPCSCGRIFRCNGRMQCRWWPRTARSPRRPCKAEHLTPSQPSRAEFPAAARTEPAAKVRQVPAEALKRELLVPQPAEIDTTATVASCGCADVAGSARRRDLRRRHHGTPGSWLRRQLPRRTWRWARLP